MEITDQVRQQSDGEFAVAGDLVSLENSLGQPATVNSRTPSISKPKSDVIIQIPPFMQPAAFVDVMSSRATDRIELPRPGHRRQELGYNVTGRRLLQMLPKRPPSEIVDFLQLFVRTIEPRNIVG